MGFSDKLKSIGVPLAASVWLGGCSHPAPPPTEVQPPKKVLPAVEPEAIPSYRDLESGSFLRRWMVCGPFAARAGEGKTLDEAARRAAFDRDLADAQRGCAWRALASDEDRVDLAGLYGPRTDAVAYAWTEVDLAAAKTFLLGIGSDDAVKIWLNGELVHENWASRPLAVDEDLVLAKMHPGKNRLLIEIYNRSEDWVFTCRALDPAALPLGRLLLRAADRRDDRLVEFLLASGADADSRDADGWTALHSAAAAGDIAIAELLLASGAAVDVRTVHGLTPLHVAQRSGHGEVAAALTARGADPGIRPTIPAHDVDDLLRVRPLFAGYPGAGALVIDRGKVVFEQAFGWANVEENAAATTGTNYRLASVSKQFTAMAAMILVDRRRLSLDTTLDRLFPGFPAYGAAITVRQLLSHTSGLPAYESLIPEGTSLQLHDLDVLQLLLATREPHFAPGTRFEYSNTGYALLALIVERASGKPFARFLADEVFGRLAMNGTVAFVAGQGAVSQRAYGYSRDGTGWKRTDQSITSAVLGDGGIYSSLDDMARWVRALDDGRLLSRSAYREMYAPAAAVDPTTAYGFGWFMDAWHGQKRLYHGGHSIGFTHFVQRFPERRAAVIIFTNEEESTARATGERVAELFLGEAGTDAARRGRPPLVGGAVEFPDKR